ncbi:23S rRNA (adenine(2503)-C(2))-methyltransferase RlmN [Acanthopleuribacter pedis]|uniref:23S rRNA (Adenine(2503)-C(2))-methyltransferase RlmN n=1 Tax=Acanthopleuribacter pedis TaxID=442870 RepID=A0A8J7Q515_9BACT|nr:23S rRNA (adenine(2503)-C(2))-methyltransferase RlmN [Acanthopleuribacter pedis]MBO1319185.1 23S rRNA (adenine(2503)-C(2))-methyltransferase RlmN [Acanthopleuribacter pedis]
METFTWEQIDETSYYDCLLDYSHAELTRLVAERGFKSIHADRLFAALHRGDHDDPTLFDRLQLPKPMLALLNSDDAPKRSPFQRIEAFPSNDGSVKYLYHLPNGAQIESVFMPFKNRNTFCISSQVGCAMGCTFCATGAMGFRKHLSAGEIVGQVLHMRLRHPNPRGQTTRFNVVFMGMGEPLHNLNNVMKTVDLLTDPHGLVLSERDIAVSTSGLVPKIEQMASYKKRPHLMVSIAATNDGNRSSIMPVNRAYNLEKLLACLERYPLRRRERIMLSYVVIAGVNDRDEDIAALLAMSQRFPSMINLIPMNEHELSPGMQEPEEKRLQRMYQTLLDAGAFATIRRSRGRDVAGACGQLTTQYERKAATQKGATPSPGTPV